MSDAQLRIMYKAPKLVHLLYKPGESVDARKHIPINVPNTCGPNASIGQAQRFLAIAVPENGEHDGKFTVVRQGDVIPLHYHAPITGHIESVAH